MVQMLLPPAAMGIPVKCNLTFASCHGQDHILGEKRYQFAVCMTTAARKVPRSALQSSSILEVHDLDSEQITAQHGTATAL